MTLPDLAPLARLDERGREVAAEADAVAAALDECARAIREARAAGDRRAESRLEGYRGNALRLLGRTAGAVEALTQSVRLADEVADRRGSLVARIRLGEAYRCHADLDAAEPLLRGAVAEARAQPETDDLVDFALQHLGKMLTDAGRTEEAVACLDGALAIRRVKGDEALVASTELALARARAEPLF